jgi:hypothetical protein
MPTNLTLATLDELEAAERAATPGPWFAHKVEGLTGLDPDNSKLVALARNNTPALVAALREAWAVIGPLLGCLPDRVYISPDGDTWSSDPPDQDAERFDEYVEVDLEVFRNDNPGLLPETGEKP